MYINRWRNLLWGKQSRLLYLMLTAVVLLFGFLGSREIWTQEHRWADIVASMFFHKDFFHPILNGHEYYDKPLLSYWLIAGLSVVFGKINLWAMRMPSALAGILAVGSIYCIGARLHDKRFGLLSGWLLLTTYYFIFWARVSSADMLNMAGSLFAVAWYIEKRYELNFFNYMIFFLILAITALCKGLVGPAVAIIAIIPDLFLQKSWKRHLNMSFFLSILPAAFFYFIPFWFSHISNEHYHANGLYQVYRENVMRYFQPFDHKAPIYIYFIFLPLYLFPWALFFLPALYFLKHRWKNLSVHSKWIVWATLLLFLFFTFSGSRRSYYILPMIPFAILLTADWIYSDPHSRRYRFAGVTAFLSLILLTIIFLFLQPAYYSRGGITTFSSKVQAEAEKIKPWSQWQVSLLDAENKVSYYLNLSPDIENQDTKTAREKQTIISMIQNWKILSTQPSNTIIISRKLHAANLGSILKNYILVEPEPTYLELFLKKPDSNLPVAFIPKKVNG